MSSTDDPEREEIHVVNSKNACHSNDLVLGLFCQHSNCTALYHTYDWEGRTDISSRVGQGKSDDVVRLTGRH